MKSRIVSSIVAASLLVVLSVALAYAGSTARLHVTVPFAFTAGSVSFPSGDYTISETTMQGYLRIQNTRENVATFVSTIGVQSFGQYGDAKILFNRYSEKYFLSQVFYGIGEDARKLPVSRLERDSIGAAQSVAQNSRMPEVVVVGTR